MSLLLLCSFLASAQEKFSPKYLTEKNDPLARDAKTLTQNGWIELKEETSVAPDQFFERYGASLGLALNPQLSIQRVKSETGEKNTEHRRYQVYYDGIEVEGMEYSLHSQNGKVQWARGRIVSEIEINTKEVLSERDALQSALKELGIATEQYEKEQPRAERVIGRADITDFSPASFKLMYKFLLTSKKPFDIFFAYVDAKTGKVVKSITTIQNCFAPDAMHPSPSMANGTYSLESLLAPASPLVASTFVPNKARYLQGQTNLTFETEFVPNTSNQQLAWRNFAPGRFDLQVKEYTNADFALNTNTPAQQDQIFDDMPLVVNPNTTWQANHQEATTSHWAMEQTQNYYQSIHQRNGPANNGRIGRVITNVPSNAPFGFLGPTRFTQYGNVPGWGLIILQSEAGQSWSALDIIAHEYTHGTTQNTSNLVYQGESGALNEGISDIIGYCVERRTLPNNWNWQLGEDANGTSFRDMFNPHTRQDPDTYQGLFWKNTTNTNDDHGGVHTNSGVLNHWFYRLVAGGTKNGVTVTGISFERAEAIVYDAFFNRMQSTDQYADARLATLAAAQSLYGNCSTEFRQVGAAWAAVGVGTGSGCSANCNFTVTASASPNPLPCGSQVTLTGNCSGPDCGGVNYSWTGPGVNTINGNGQSINITSQTTPGRGYYYVNYSKTGCSAGSDIVGVYTNCGPPLSNGCYTIKSKHSDKYMQPENGNNGARIRQYSANGQNNQIFDLEWVDNDSYKIKSYGTNKVWEAAGAGTSYQTAVQLSDYSGGNHQKWLLSSWGDGSYRLSPKHASSLLADVENVSSADGAGLHLWGEHGGNNQRFYLNSLVCPTTGSCPTPTLTATPSSITNGQSSTLNASGCSGTVTWSNGLGTGSSKSVSPGSTTTYTATCTANGCTSAPGSVTVYVGPPPGNNCLNLSDLCSGNSSEVRNYNMPLSSGGNKTVTFTYRSHEGAGTLNFVLNGTLHTISLPQTTLSYATITLPGTYPFNTSNSIALSSGGGYICFREICVDGGGGGCQTPNPPSVSANPTTINSGGSTQLSATGCSGTVNWSNGAGSGNPVTAYPSGTTTYTATCTVNGCTSGASNGVTVTVNGGGGGSSCINLNDLCSGNSSEVRSYNFNMSSGGSKALTLTYRAHEGNATGRIRINNGSWQDFPLSQTPSDLSYVTTGIGSYSFNSGNNSVDFASNGGYICFRELCSGSGARLGVAEESTIDSPELTVSPNPNDGEFEARFYVEPGRRATLRVSDLQGREVWQKSLVGAGAHSEPVRLPAQSVGSFILLLDKEATAASDKSEFKRVIVVK